MPAAGWAWWVIVVLPATAALGYSASHLHHGGWTRFAVLTVAASLAQLAVVENPGLRVFHPAIVFTVAGALTLSPEQVVLMCALQHLPDWLKQRYAWYIQPFNIADYVFAALAAWGLADGFHHLAGGSGVAVAGAGVAASIGFVVVNRLLLLPMLTLGRELRIKETRLLAVDDIALELVLALMAVALVALWHRSIALAAISLAPLVLIYFTQLAQSRLAGAREEVKRRSTNALEALSATVDARDKYTHGHSRRVRELATLIARELGLDDVAVENVGQAALLHDIGKIGVSDEVLLKNGELTQLQEKEMRTHPGEGARIIERLGYLDAVVPGIRHHHERIDGRGYPDGLIGDEIPLLARIIHVADAYDAMTTKRVYRDALSDDQAIDEIRRGRGTDFCEHCADALDRTVARGPIPRLVDAREPAA
ncbi:MAG TPA: HD-GYP domain-containing protein [Gaiellaceae bacterium]|nr:HD-GYP domain-containing protein [Gaiellaceae bacterium]